MALIVLLAFLLVLLTVPVNAASNAASESSYVCKPNWGLRCFEVDAEGARLKGGRALWRGSSIPATEIDMLIQARNGRYYRLVDFTTE